MSEKIEKETSDNTLEEKITEQVENKNDEVDSAKKQ